MSRSRKIETRQGAELVRQEPWGHLLIEGDSGGEVYLACPANKLMAAPESLFLLMHDLECIEQTGALSPLHLENNVCFPGYDAWMRQIELGVINNYQNAEISPDVWVNQAFEKRGLSESIRRVVVGEIARIEL